MMETTDEKIDDIRWEMSNDIIREDDNEWKKRRAVPLLDLKNVVNQEETASSYFTLYDEGHTRIMASLVPDEIIYNIGDYSKREFDGCLLFGDVSGFTDLCEKYNKSGKGGPSRLTQVLNNYIGAMVQEIMSHGGDVLNFSGDAFIALWKVTDQLSMRDAVHEGIDCSLIIQKTYGTYQTDVDVVVRVKLAVASGHLVFSLLGNKESSHYLMTGDPIDAIKAAESKSSAGEIVITARVSRHISANEYLIKVLPDGLHAKVLGVGPNWRNIQRQYDDKESYAAFGKDIEGEVSIQSEGSISSDLTVNEIEDEEGVGQIVTDQYALRPAVNHAARQKLKDELRRFIIPPVVRGIDASEPLEYLTEIRQVAILFINCKVSVSVGPAQGIDVADTVYTTVYNIVKDRYGCVNKISNFDKDLMLLTIFGLRGFKHELESQIALMCATECFERISALREIDEISVGVTTGRCYCGAFGHTLRREYTVIGLVVNKAARLMMAYPNSVTCDRETFLYSKLEARNFVLQEYKPLKGIAQAGPIYAFQAVERTHDLGFSISSFPLLGREQELELFSILERKAKAAFYKKDPGLVYNMLVIRGDFRQGKTRLLEEILYISDADVPFHTFTLTVSDREIQYRAIQFIFSKFIGEPGASSVSQREHKLQSRLHTKKAKENLFVLNNVFNVQFPVTREIRSREKYLELLTKMFTLLCTQCFSKFWLIAIDEADYVDDESWMLIQVFLDLHVGFIVATMSSQKELTSYAIKVLRHENIKVIRLKPIDKWYHVGLICQMLNIGGIPPELEKAIQIRSNGNPGWIESFLVTLVQSGGITIKEMKRIKAYRSGVVIPPVYMIMRLSKQETDLWMDVMEERAFCKHDEDISKRWKIYIDSCRESYPNLTIAQSFEGYQKDSRVKVAYINPEFNLEDTIPEQHMDVVILKTFDSLTSYEQLLLKCSAVLGDIFPRDMLLYIMSSTATRLTALAVQKLFEIQVLSCARGNFHEGGLNFKDRLMDPNEDLSVKCECIGLLMEDVCIDLPKYASCGYMRFRSSEFRETTYNLLTDNQKREFHGKAIRYMEKETRRCRACGSGYFTRYLGSGRLDDGLRSRMRQKKFSIGGTTIDSLENHNEKGSLTRKASSTSAGKSYSGSLRSRETYLRGSSGSAAEAVSLGPSTAFEISGTGYTTIRKLKDNYNLVRTFSAYDYSNCTCLLILSTMYSQLIEHCKGAGLVEKIMVATIEYSYVCMENKNAPQAIKVLEEALELLEGPMKDQIELEWMVALKRGKLFALLGRARMYLEDEEAYTYFNEALRCYGISFPTSNLGKRIFINHFKLKQFFRFYVFSDSLQTKGFDEDVADYCNNVSECLHFLCSYYIVRRKWREAELAAIWSLNKALETESDFEILCLSYASMIYMTTVTMQHKLTVALEVFALRTCHRKKTIVELEELKAVSMLYFNIGRSRIMRGEIDKSVHMSFPIWRISTAAKSSQLLFFGFPLIAFGTLLRKQLIEFGNILTEIAYMMDQDVDNSEKLWYHALCLVLHLDTGFTIASLEKTNKFLQNHTYEPYLRDGTGQMRLFICKWLWEVRNENWEAATMFQMLAWKLTIADRGEKLYNLISALYLIEGLIIFMVNKMDTKNIVACSKAEKRILLLFGRLQKASKICKVLLPRLNHMKAYYTMVKLNNLKTTYRYLKRAHKYAEMQHNELEMCWLEHSELAWTNKLNTEEMYAWRERCEDGNSVTFNEVETVDKLAFYSLPLPIYI